MLLKYKENDKKICDTFGHNFRYIYTFMYNGLDIIRKALFCITVLAIIFAFLD